MPLEVARVRRSKAWLKCKRTPELAFYLINLWTASWHERPAASLEDDDDVLADMAMCTPEKWDALREDILRGWVKCTDGRLYHPVVAEKANEAWQGKLEHRWKQHCGSLKKACQRANTVYSPPSFEEWLSQGQSKSVPGTIANVPGDIALTDDDSSSDNKKSPEGHCSQERGRGREIGTGKENPSLQDAGTNVVRLRPMTADTDRAIPMTLDWRPSEGIYARMAVMGVHKSALTDAAMNEFASYWQSRVGMASQGEWEHKLAARLKNRPAVPQKAASGSEKFNGFQEKDYSQGTGTFAPHQELFSDVED